MNTYKRHRSAAGMTVREVASLIKETHPKFSISAMSQVENSELSGVTFTVSGREAFYSAVGGRRVENRRCPCRWSFRVTKQLSELLNELQARQGFATKDAFLNHIVFVYITTACPNVEVSINETVYQR